MFKGHFIFQPSISRGYVSFQEGDIWGILGVAFSDQQLHLMRSVYKDPLWIFPSNCCPGIHSKKWYHFTKSFPTFGYTSSRPFFVTSQTEPFFLNFVRNACGTRLKKGGNGVSDKSPWVWKSSGKRPWPSQNVAWWRRPNERWKWN